jgi:hypothetical protein
LAAQRAHHASKSLIYAPFSLVKIVSTMDDDDGKFKQDLSACNASHDRLIETPLDGPPSDWKPLFIEWLTELKAAAQRKNSKVQHVYAKAIRSLRKYPLPLSCGSEAVKLEVELQYIATGAAMMLFVCRVLDEALPNCWTTRFNHTALPTIGCLL